jgi:hypothetical protein
VDRQGFDRAYLFCEGGFGMHVRRTIGALRRRGVSVEALGGEPRWGVGDRDGLLRFVESARHYQRHAQPGRRLAGVHLDIEPYSLPVWNRERRDTERRYLSALVSARAAVRPLPVRVDVPFWFDDVHLRDRGERHSLLGEVLGRVHGISVMAYRDTAADIVAVARREISAAGRRGKRAVVGVETGPVRPEQVTFAEEGRAALGTALTHVRRRLEGRRGFGGIAIHSWTWLKRLGP